MINTEKEQAVFNFYPCEGELKGILSIPHSGEFLPDQFKSFLSNNFKDLMQDVDYKVHELIDIPKLQKAGISVLKSNIIRTAIDLNRSKDICLFSWENNSKGTKIVLSRPKAETSAQLVEMYYAPYYEMLKTLIVNLQSKMQVPSLVDLHSMPANAEEYHLKINPKQEKIRPDFCISDISGISCEPEFIDDVTKSLASSYAKVYQNNPYFGGNITRFLHKTYTPLNNIQIEISRGLYMDEETKNLKQLGVDKLTNNLTESLIKLYQKFWEKYKF